MSNFWKSSPPLAARGDHQPGSHCSNTLFCRPAAFCRCDPVGELLAAAHRLFGVNRLAARARDGLAHIAEGKSHLIVTSFLTVCEGYLLNNFLPFRLGEIGRAFLMGRKSKLGFMEVLPTIVIERILDFAFAAAVLLSAIPFVVGATEAARVAVIIGVAGDSWAGCLIHPGAQPGLGHGSVWSFELPLAHCPKTRRGVPGILFHRTVHPHQRLAFCPGFIMDAA